MVYISDDNLHHIGISLITVSVIYLSYLTLITGKALLPSMFYLIYGLGGLSIALEMHSRDDMYVFVNEIIGVIISFSLGLHSMMSRGRR